MKQLKLSRLFSLLLALTLDYAATALQSVPARRRRLPERL